MSVMAGALVVVALVAPNASIGSSDPDVEPLPSLPDQVEIENDDYEPGVSEESQSPEDSVPFDDGGVSAEWVYEWRSPCAASDAICQAALTCGEPGYTRWLLYGRVPPGSWQALGSVCHGGSGEPPPEAVEVFEPQVTEGDVLRAVRTIGLPSLEVQVQPEGDTLVNFDTLFYTEPEMFEHTVTLLGDAVTISAEPVSYTWHTGDGTTLETTTPGAPYPAKDVVHQYTDAHVTVNPSVDVTYQVTWSVNGGDTQTLGETLTATGEPTNLHIREATPLLTTTR